MQSAFRGVLFGSSDNESVCDAGTKEQLTEEMRKTFFFEIPAGRYDKRDQLASKYKDRRGKKRYKYLAHFFSPADLPLREQRRRLLGYR